MTHIMNFKKKKFKKLKINKKKIHFFKPEVELKC